MPSQQRRAEAVWKGDLVNGHGTLNTQSGVLQNQPVSWSARSEAPGGKTSPEELLAAAQAVCYAMAFSNTLAQQGTAPTRLDVSATCSMQLSEAGLKITTMDITVKGQVPGMQQSDFAALAQKAEQNCPVSNALRNNLTINVQAQLENG